MDTTPVERTRTAYTTVAAAYDEVLADTSFEADVDLAMIGHFVDRLGIGRGAAVLDAGCGAGRMLTHLREVDPTLGLAGIDLAPGMVERARAHHPGLPIDEADLAAIPHHDERFDGVLAWYSIIHTPVAELPRFAAEVRRVLRPGGLLLLGFHAGAGERLARRAYGHDVDLLVQLHDVQGVAGTMTTGGFEVVARLERAARPVERHAQGFVLARRD